VFNTGLGLVVGMVVGLGVDGIQPMVLYFSMVRRSEKWDVECGMWKCLTMGEGWYERSRWVKEDMWWRGVAVTNGK